MVCQFLLYNKVNQIDIYIYTHISSLLHLPLTPPSHASRWTGSTKLISLCYVAVSHQLSILHLVVVYMSMPLSHFVPAYPSPSLCPQDHSLRLHLYSCPAPSFFRTIFGFGFHIYMLAYGICFSLCDLLHCMTVSRSIHLTKNNSVLFLYMPE